MTQLTKIFTPLTATERQILVLLSAGCTDCDIEQRLSMNKHTLRTHIDHVFCKMQCACRAQLASYCLLAGVVHSEDIIAVWRDINPGLIAGD